MPPSPSPPIPDEDPDSATATLPLPLSASLILTALPQDASAALAKAADDVDGVPAKGPFVIYLFLPPSFPLPRTFPQNGDWCIFF